MSAGLLEQIYIRLGRPWWFWPAVMVTLFIVFVAGSSICEDIHE